MAENSKIEWTDHTFNPWTGCTKVSPGCDGCYAEAWSKRAGDNAGKWGPGAPRRRTNAFNWRKPIKWEKNAAEFFAKHGRRQRVFCASLADVFDNEVPSQWRYDLFNLILSTPSLDWLLLTKRIGNAARMIEEVLPESMKALPPDHPLAWPWPNVWIGATITGQAEADRDVPKLLAVPAHVRFLSMEPLLGPVDLTSIRQQIDGDSYTESNVLVHKSTLDRGASRPAVDWVIVGGESGPGARPMHPDWARSLRDQCTAAGVPFLFKQHGEWLATAFCDDEMAMIPSKRTVYVGRDGVFHDGSGGVDFFGGEEETAWVGKKAAGRLLDSREHNGFPEVNHG